MIEHQSILPIAQVKIVLEDGASHKKSPDDSCLDKIRPLFKECGVCDVSYDLVYDLDQGLQQLSVVGQAVGLDIDPK